MSNINALETLATVQDLDDTAAATCGGGYNPGIILYEHENFNRNKPGMVRGYTGSVYNVGRDFNDKASSVWVNWGQWVLCRDEGYNVPLTGTLVRNGRGYSLPGGMNDNTTSIRRVR